MLFFSCNPHYIFFYKQCFLSFFSIMTHLSGLVSTFLSIIQFLKHSIEITRSNEHIYQIAVPLIALLLMSTVNSLREDFDKDMITSGDRESCNAQPPRLRNFEQLPNHVRNIILNIWYIYLN